MKLTHIISGVLILFSFVTNSQNIKLNIAPVNVNEDIPKIIGIDFEDYIKSLPNLETGIEYYFSEPNYSGDGDYEGIRFRMSYKLYFNKDVQYQGGFLAPSVYYLNTSVPEQDEPFVFQTKGTRNAFGFGLKFGYQKVFAKRLILGAYFNPVLYYNEIYIEYDDGSKKKYNKNTLEFELGISLGFIFEKIK